jgi:hypothetical protein
MLYVVLSVLGSLGATIIGFAGARLLLELRHPA